MTDSTGVPDLPACWAVALGLVRPSAGCAAADPPESGLWLTDLPGLDAQHLARGTTEPVPGLEAELRLTLAEALAALPTDCADALARWGQVHTLPHTGSLALPPPAEAVAVPNTGGGVRIRRQGYLPAADSAGPQPRLTLKWVELWAPPDPQPVTLTLTDGGHTATPTLPPPNGSPYRVYWHHAIQSGSLTLTHDARAAVPVKLPGGGLPRGWVLEGWDGSVALPESCGLRLGLVNACAWDEWLCTHRLDFVPALRWATAARVLRRRRQSGRLNPATLRTEALDGLIAEYDGLYTQALRHLADRFAPTLRRTRNPCLACAAARVVTTVL
jgi:hypothetical protein